MNIEQLYMCFSEEEKVQLLRLLTERMPLHEKHSVLTSVEDFVTKHNDVISTRLKFGLLSYSDHEDYKYVELLTFDDILKFRNLGKLAAREFIRLRGY
jgi:hypothetical protein